MNSLGILLAKEEDDDDSCPTKRVKNLFPLIPKWRGFFDFLKRNFSLKC